MLLALEPSALRMAGNPVETFQRRVGTPSGLQLTLDATVVASGLDTQVCAGSTVLPAVETADDRQSVRAAGAARGSL